MAPSAIITADDWALLPAAASRQLSSGVAALFENQRAPRPVGPAPRCLMPSDGGRRSAAGCGRFPTMPFPATWQVDRGDPIIPVSDSLLSRCLDACAPRATLLFPGCVGAPVRFSLLDHPDDVDGTAAAAPAEPARRTLNPQLKARSLRCLAGCFAHASVAPVTLMILSVP